MHVLIHTGDKGKHTIYQDEIEGIDRRKSSRIIAMEEKKKKKKKKKGVNIYVPTRWMGSHPTKSWVHVQLEEKIKRRKNVKIFLG